MPSISRRQQRAMFSAAAGKSKIGIPKKVGQEFAKADIARGPQKLPSSKGIVAKRAANNNAKGRFGLKNTVTDNDPMASRSNGNYP